jgi:hypothetical protein
MQNDEFFAVHFQNVHTVIFLVNLHGTPKQWALANGIGHKTKKNDDFFVMPLKHVPSVMDLVSQSRTPKLWALAHENGPKMQK